MRIVTLSTVAVLTMSLVVACGSREGATGRADPAAGAPPQEGGNTSPDIKTGYADVNGLKMYYEIHGAGRPLVVLHGAFGWATAPPTLAKGRQVIAVELQGHGHTADIDRPLTYEQMADDTAALLGHLQVAQADFFGYSMGGTVALAVAIRHPKLVRKLAVNGSLYGKMADAYDAETVRQFQSMSSDFAPKVLKDPYDRVAPDPAKWPVLVAKVKRMGTEFQGFRRADMQAIPAPVLITVGDRDVVRPEHAVEMFRLIPNAQLAVFPGGDHFLLWQSPDKLLPTIAAFLNEPVAEPRKPAGP